MATKPIRSTADVPGLTDALANAAVDLYCAFGDSITQGTTGNPGEANYSNYLGWLKGVTVYNAGISGNHLHDMVARLPALLALGFGTFLNMGGTNDIAATDYNLATMQGHVVTITEMQLAAGVTPIWMTVTPRSDVDQKARIYAYNRFLARHCRQYGIQLIDTFSAFADANGDPKSGYLHTDNLHPSRELGRRVLAETIAAALTVPPVVEPWRYGLETLLFTNGDLLLDTNADGLANGFTVIKSAAVTVTHSLSAHETVGNWQLYSRSVGSPGENAQIQSSDFGASVTGGDVLDLEFDLKTSAAMNGNYVTAYLKPQTAGSVNLTTQYFIPSIYAPLGTSTRIRGSVTVPATTGKATLFFGMYGAGASDISIGRINLRKRVV